MNAKKDSLFENAQIISMFPTFVWETVLKGDIREELNPRLADTLFELRRADPEAGRRAGWQSAQDLHRRDAFQPLVGAIRDAAATVLAFLKIGHEGFEITGCWGNLNGPGAAHKAHSHPNNYLSGVYYVRVPEGADTINFHDPRLQTGIIRPPVTELTNENTDQVVVRVQEGSLLLFPAWLEHSVDANPGEETRISVSFNLMFSPYVETMSRPLW